MLSGGMQGYAGYGETKGGGGIQTFQKSCKLNLLFVLILRDKCVVHFFFFLQKLELKKIKALQNFNSSNVVASRKKNGGEGYMWFFKKPECFLDLIFTAA